MRELTYGQGIKEGMRIKMLENPDVFIFGEDVGLFGGCFGVTAGLFEEFGEKRVRDTPISEGAIIGAAVGAAAVGLRPIPELMFVDFATVGMDQLVNQAAKMRYMFGGKLKLPMVVRLPSGGGVAAAAQHSQSLEAWFTHVEDEVKPIPLGKANIKREGSDVTIITYGKQVYDSLKAAEILEKDGIDVEVIDLRSLYPLDTEAIFESVKKTHKVVIVSEEAKRGSYAGELAAIIADECFYECDAPIKRVCALNTPIPFSGNLEAYVLPNADDVVQAIKSLF